MYFSFYRYSHSLHVFIFCLPWIWYSIHFVLYAPWNSGDPYTIDFSFDAFFFALITKKLLSRRRQRAYFWTYTAHRTTSLFFRDFRKTILIKKRCLWKKTRLARTGCNKCLGYEPENKEERQLAELQTNSKTNTSTGSAGTLWGAWKRVGIFKRKLPSKSERGVKRLLIWIITMFFLILYNLLVGCLFLIVSIFVFHMFFKYSIKVVAMRWITTFVYSFFVSLLFLVVFFIFSIVFFSHFSPKKSKWFWIFFLLDILTPSKCTCSDFAIVAVANWHTVSRVVTCLQTPPRRPAQLSSSLFVTFMHIFSASLFICVSLRECTLTLHWVQPGELNSKVSYGTNLPNQKHSNSNCLPSSLSLSLS